MTQPHSLDLEVALLGGVLIDPALLFELRDRIEPADFYRLAYRRVYEVYLALADRQEAIDPFSVQQGLTSQGWGDEMSVAQLTALTDGIPRTGLTIGPMADRLRDLAEQRRLHMVCERAAVTIRQAVSSEAAALALVQQIQASVTTRAGDGQSLATALQAAVARLDEPPAVAPTGLPTLDRWGCGCRPGELVILAGRPSMGKTALALHVARALGGAGVRVWLVTREMSTEDLTLRWLASEAQVDLGLLRSGRLGDEDLTRVSQAMGTLSDLPIVIDEVGRGLADIRRAVVGQSGVVIVDYLQLLQPPRTGRDAGNRTQEVGALSRGLKAIAHEAKVTVLALSQLSRKVEERQHKAPQLSDLRDSGELEQDADQVWMLWRPHLYDQHEEVRRACLKVAKHRNGPTGTIELIFEPTQVRFRERTLQDGIVASSSTRSSRAQRVAKGWGAA